MNRRSIISLLFLASMILFVNHCTCSYTENSSVKKEETATAKDTKDAKNNKYQSYRDAVKVGDFEAAYDSLNNYHKTYIYYQAKNGILNRSSRKYSESRYYEAFDYIYKAEVRHILTQMDGREAIDKIFFLLDEIPIEGERSPQGLCDYNLVCRGDWGDEGIPLDAYIVWTQHFNDLCMSILNLAINRKNKDLARQILVHFVDNVEAIKGSSSERIVVNNVRVDGNHGYIKYTKVDAQAAKKKYDNAVATGMFN